jgi:hypothetical protein|tara:strand:+ start:115 stop:519 length:405 start_codon:yes stop_codon:yes gene_type:complete
MSFSSKNGISMCDIASFNNISRDGSKCLGLTKGVSCTKEPLVTDGPAETKAAICTDFRDRSPNGPIKFSGTGPPGIVNINSDLTITKGVCSAGNRLPQGWYIFWGKEGPGYDGYQVAYLSGSDCGATTLVLNDC